MATPSENNRPGRISFKNIVRSIIRARRWQISFVGGKDGTSSDELENNNSSDEDKDALHFNVDAYKAGPSGHAGLSKRAKFILMKNAAERTDEELDLIHPVVDQMKCFEKYPLMVRRELTRVMHFETIDDGRKILQEGHPGFSMYFILSGSVLRQATTEDTRTHEKRTQIVGEMSAGSSFGELALIQDCTRTATIVCKGTSQFLRVDKSDFNMVLRRSCEKELEDRLQIVLLIPFIQQWYDVDIRNINMNSKIEEFPADTIIFGNTSGVSEQIYFVVSGSCKLVRKIHVISTKDRLGRTILSLPSRREEAISEDNGELQIRFLQIGTLAYADYFGAGEDMTNVYVIASGRVKCLMIPRYVIISLERQDSTGKEFRKLGALKEMMKNTSARILSETEAFDKWMVNVGWKNYKKKISTEILSRRGLKYNQQTTKFGLPNPPNKKKIEENVHHKRIIVLNSQKKKHLNAKN